jgi:hypothetical protein
VGEAVAAAFRHRPERAFTKAAARRRRPSTSLSIRFGAGAGGDIFRLVGGIGRFVADARFFTYPSYSALPATVEPAIRNAGLTVDRDTLGIAGSPPIVDEIFKKIDKAFAFVADVTFVGTRRDGRPTPNPNVLLEYGWALKSRGYYTIIPVMNTAYGEPSDQTLPFNMKHLRWPITYCLPDGADEATTQKVRSELVGILKAALRTIAESDEFKASIPKPPEVPAFVEMQPVDGSARFHPRNQPIGVVEAPFGFGDSHEVTLADGPAIWLRVMPDRTQARQWTVAELRAKMSTTGRQLLPLGNFNSWNYLRTAEGFGCVPTTADKADRIPAVMVAFKTGEVWSVYSGPASMHQSVGSLEPFFVECFMRCVAFLRDGLKISTPYRWIAGIEGLKGKKMYKVAAPGRGFLDQLTGQSLQDVVTERCLITDLDKVQLALVPFFRKLHDAFGIERLGHMDQALFQSFPD